MRQADRSADPPRSDRPPPSVDPSIPSTPPPPFPCPRPPRQPSAVIHTVITRHSLARTTRGLQNVADGPDCPAVHGAGPPRQVGSTEAGDHRSTPVCRRGLTIRHHSVQFVQKQHGCSGLVDIAPYLPTAPLGSGQVWTEGPQCPAEGPSARRFRRSRGATSPSRRLLKQVLLRLRIDSALRGPLRDLGLHGATALLTPHGSVETLVRITPPPFPLPSIRSAEDEEVWAPLPVSVAPR
jgi:hypothetical protein